MNVFHPLKKEKKKNTRFEWNKFYVTIKNGTEIGNVNAMHVRAPFHVYTLAAF